MSWDDFDLTDGVSPTEFFILDEMVLKDIDEELDEGNTDNSGCFSVLMLILIVVLWWSRI